VLVVGGIEGATYLASTELYDPATAEWSNTGSLTTARDFQTANLLPNGKVLVAGGDGSGDVALASAELYNPDKGTWSVTGSLKTARDDDTGTLLADGKVLVAGGNPTDLTSAELYNVSTATWSVTGNLNNGRADDVETLLPTGMVLVAGGTAVHPDTCELYDAVSGTWSLTGSLNAPRKDHTATLLPSGMVLVTGGGSTHGVPIASAELYDPGIVTATKVDGHGTIDNQGDQVTFHLHATLSDETNRADFFSFCDSIASVCLTNAGILSLSINGNTAACSGTGRLDDGTKVSFIVNVTDNGSPGTSDTISITLNDGYSVSGTLTSGDIQIH
jgi:hypothetical protein